ncbi:hypothetical protein T484DRAFT_1788798 [Baffinella frigidus]|nr:hypothetical protein T484DRAFT_1788798 [Cryptophyta sp. CCMP2293]
MRGGRRALRTAVGVWLLVGVASGGIAGARGTTGHLGSKKATLCSQASDCEHCFLRMECYSLPKQDPICYPCGWCAEKGAWGADQAGTCERIDAPDVSFCVSDTPDPFPNPQDDAYCPNTVCNVTAANSTKKDDVCACDFNECPFVSLLLRLLRLEGFYVLVVLVILITIGVFSVCNTLVWFRAPPPGIILVRDRAEDEDSLQDREEREEREREGESAASEAPGASSDYRRMPQK